MSSNSSRVRAVPRREGGQSKGITMFYGGLSLTLLVLIASVALVVKPPSPPALAEFAPQAEQTIDEGPQDQSSRFGTGGAGTCAPGQEGCGGVGSPAAEAAQDEEDASEGGRRVIEKPRVKRCIGDPPRQIEDPQSPPCADYWEGPDNGGATAPGVTRDEIRIGVAIGSRLINRPTSEIRKEDADLAGFFDRRFEFYGRTLTIVPMRNPGTSGELQRAAADEAAELKVFAALMGPTIGQFGNTFRSFRKRLAEHRIIGIVPREPFATEAEYAAVHPYFWSYLPTFDRLGGDLGEFVCDSLHGYPASYARGLERDKPRKFAVIRGLASYDYVDPAPLLDEMRTCLGSVVVKEIAGDHRARAESKPVLDDLRNQGVTTIIPMSTEETFFATLQDVATEIAYSPEWLLLGDGWREQFDEDSYQLDPTPEQRAAMLGLFADNKFQAVPDRPSTWAYREEGIETYAEEYPGTHEFEELYRVFLLLASGIQAAGPNLTPETFAKGLQRLQFPNPGAGAAPYYQGHVGFTGDHTMVNDEAVVAWRETAQAYSSNLRDKPGGWCYLDRGARWRRGQWPKRPFALSSEPTAECR